MVDWILVDETIAEIGFYLTITSQFLLIYLTLFLIQRDFGAYKYLIILFSIIGIFFASCEFSFFPILHSYNGGYVYFTVTQPLGFSNEVMKVVMVTYTGLYSATISLLAVQFIYRFLAVFHVSLLKYFSGCYFLLWVLYIVWFGVEWALGLYFFAALDEYSEEYMRPELINFYGCDISELPCLSVVVYEMDNRTNTARVRWWNVMCTFNMTFIMLSQYSIMAFCGYRLYSEMNEKINILSKSLRKLHRQIFKALTLQIVTPTLVLFSPIIFTIYAPLFDQEMSIPTGVFLSGFALYPAFDAIIVMYVITDYRKAFFRMAHISQSASRSS